MFFICCRHLQRDQKVSTALHHWSFEGCLVKHKSWILHVCMRKMQKKLALLGFAFLCIMALVLSSGLAASEIGQYPHLSSVESEIVSRINGTNIYNYDLEMEKIALNHSISLYSFRSSGSVGANKTASWIQEQFESFGLETHNETFELTTWNLLAQPVLIIDADGNLSTTDDQATIRSFQCEHYSWPTPDAGVFAGLVTLPLPYTGAGWVSVNTTGKVLLIGAEVESNSNWYLAFHNKLEGQTPAAVIFAWSSSSMASALPVFDSAGGRPASTGAYFWNLNIPVGWVSYEDGQLIRSKIAAENVSAFVSVPAVIGQGPHYNIVAELPGSVDPEKMIIISGHYDSVMDAAFCDDGAGTAAVIELSRVFSEAAQEGLYKPQYTLVFIAFAGGELGLAGSVNYVKQHTSELGNVVAVINFDSLGSKTMQITKTFPDDRGLDLQSIIMNAGNDLGVRIDLIDPGVRDSDQQAFLDPADTNDLYLQFWGVRLGISNMTRVKSSTMISSYPLTWIHTEDDNSTSTTTLGWVTADNLETQTRVGGLSVIRVLSSIFSPFLLELYGSVAAIGVVVVVAAYFERSRLRTFYGHFRQEVRSYVGLRETLYIIILTVFFMFLSFALHARVGETEIIINGYPRIATTEFYGTPFEMFSIVPPELAGSEGGSQFTQVQAANITLLWGGLLASIVLFSLSAFAITFTVTRLRHHRELTRYRDRV
jgi:hypothetical protein